METSALMEKAREAALAPQPPVMACLSCGALQVAGLDVCGLCFLCCGPLVLNGPELYTDENEKGKS